MLSHENHIVALTRTDDRPFERELLDRILSPMAERFGAHFGVSDRFFDFRQLRRYYKSCRIALEYGLAEGGDQKVLHFADYAAEHLQHILFERSVDESFLDSRVSMLSRYDAHRDQELLKTLRTYLELGQNKTLAAEELCLHRNTLIYRLEAIKRVSGIDLTKRMGDSQKALHLLHSCLFLENHEYAWGQAP